MRMSIDMMRIGSILPLFGIGHLYNWREVKYVFSQDLHTRSQLVNWHDGTLALLGPLSRGIKLTAWLLKLSILYSEPEGLQVILFNDNVSQIINTILSSLRTHSTRVLFYMTMTILCLILFLTPCLGPVKAYSIWISRTGRIIFAGNITQKTHFNFNCIV